MILSCNGYIITALACLVLTMMSIGLALPTQVTVSLTALSGGLFITPTVKHILRRRSLIQAHAIRSS